MKRRSFAKYILVTSIRAASPMVACANDPLPSRPVEGPLPTQLDAWPDAADDASNGNDGEQDGDASDAQDDAAADAPDANEATDAADDAPNDSADFWVAGACAPFANEAQLVSAVPAQAGAPIKDNGAGLTSIPTGTYRLVAVYTHGTTWPGSARQTIRISRPGSQTLLDIAAQSGADATFTSSRLTGAGNNLARTDLCYPTGSANVCHGAVDCAFTFGLDLTGTTPQLRIYDRVGLATRTEFVYARTHE